MTALLPREWCFDEASGAIVSDGAAIRVVALPASEAAEIEGAQEQVEDLYRDLFEITETPVARAKTAVATAFTEPADPKAAVLPSRTVLAFYDAKPADQESDRVAAFTRVSFDGERVIVSSIAVTFEITEAQQQEVLRAVVAVTEELTQAMAKNALMAAVAAAAENDKKEDTVRPVMIWQGQLGASDFLKQLFQERGFNTELMDRLEMTALLKDVGDSNLETLWKSLGISKALVQVDGIEIRPLDLANDDLIKVYDVVKLAFGGNPPSFDAWKRHYAQQPRFAPELSFIAWKDDEPVSISLIEFIVEGEGGGDAELEPLYVTDSQIKNAAKSESFTETNQMQLQFPEDYDERKAAIRTMAKTAYVCGVATLPAYRGKHLAQNLLRSNFQAGTRAGLESIYLGTDRSNPAAVRAYTQAGMVETKSANTGRVTAKLVPLRP